jgi:hypothetical protein
MPVFQGQAGEKSLLQLIVYIKSFSAPTNPTYSSEAVCSL